MRNTSVTRAIAILLELLLFVGVGFSALGVVL